MSLTVDDVPEVARLAWIRLRDELRAILGEDLVALWGHGGMTAPDPSAAHGDLDTYALVHRATDEMTARRIEGAHAAIASELGVEWDAWYVLADDARLPQSPAHVFRTGRRDTSWAIHRAYWLAGRYVHLYGQEPSAIVPTPTWAELDFDLQRELEHL